MADETAVVSGNSFAASLRNVGPTRIRPSIRPSHIPCSRAGIAAPVVQREHGGVLLVARRGFENAVEDFQKIVVELAVGDDGSDADRVHPAVGQGARGGAWADNVSRAAACRMAPRVSGAMRDDVRAALSTADAAMADTPAARTDIRQGGRPGRFFSQVPDHILNIRDGWLGRGDLAGGIVGQIDGHGGRAGGGAYDQPRAGR